jgi:hypothetical protein
MFLYISDIVEETHLRVRRHSLNHNIFIIHAINKERGKKVPTLLLPIRFWECDFDQLSSRIYILFVLNYWPIGVAVSKDNLADVLLSDSQTDSSSSGGESVRVYSRMGYIY